MRYVDAHNAVIFYLPRPAVAGGYLGQGFCYSLEDDPTAPMPLIRFPFKKRVRLDNIKRPTHIAGMLMLFMSYALYQLLI